MQKHPEHSSLLQFDILNREAGIKHFCTTRKGGVSRGPFLSLNLGNYSDDNPMDIYENRQILSRMWYMDISDFIVPHQTHGNKVLRIDDAFMQASASQKTEMLYGVDATITQLKNVFLCVTTADCVPILLYDKKNQVIAAIHAGWKGILKGIISETIGDMMLYYKTQTSDLIVAMGPSISQKHFEVDKDLVYEFINAGFELTGAMYHLDKTNKWYLDLKTICKSDMIVIGVNRDNIEASTLCTFQEADLFFSARRQSILSGRMLSGIMMADTQE